MKCKVVSNNGLGEWDDHLANKNNTMGFWDSFDTSGLMDFMSEVGQNLTPVLQTAVQQEAMDILGVRRPTAQPPAVVSAPNTGPVSVPSSGGSYAPVASNKILGMSPTIFYSIIGVSLASIIGFFVYKKMNK